MWAQVDVRPPLTLHSFTLTTPFVTQGGILMYEALYDKRPGCYPPLGQGEVRHRYESVTERKGDLGTVIRENVAMIRRAAWLPGHHLVGHGAANVPLDLPAGKYLFTATAVYTCQGSPHLLQTISPPALVEVLPDI